MCYGCTSGSLFRGLGYDKQIVRKIERKTKIPAVATAGAVVDALAQLHVKKLSLATPYKREIDLLESEFLKDSGFEVIGIESLGLTKNLQIGLQSPEVVYKLVKKVYSGSEDGIFISCTNFRTIEVIERLESELGRPVISSNTATAWKALRTLGVKDKVPSYGRLLELL